MFGAQDFTEGEVIYYPMHGVGRIDSIEQYDLKDVGNVYYYVLLFFNDGIKIMVPVENAVDTGMRYVLAGDRVEEVLEALRRTADAPERNWNKRYKSNMEKLYKGETLDVAEVVKALSTREREKTLSAGEKKMLMTARKMLIAELVQAGLGLENEVTDMIDKCVGQDE